MRQIVTPEVQAILPDVFIKYLWDLAMQNEMEECVQKFFLAPIMLGGKELQEITHSTNENITIHRIFGIKPVRENILMKQLGGKQYEMSLAS